MDPDAPMCGSKSFISLGESGRNEKKKNKNTNSQQQQPPSQPKQDTTSPPELNRQRSKKEKPSSSGGGGHHHQSRGGAVQFDDEPQPPPRHHQTRGVTSRTAPPPETTRRTFPTAAAATTTTTRTKKSDDSFIQMIAGNSSRNEKDRSLIGGGGGAVGRGGEDKTRNRLMDALMGGGVGKTEEDEYLEAVSEEEEDNVDAPWMQGSVIRIDENPSVSVVPGGGGGGLATRPEHVGTGGGEEEEEEEEIAVEGMTGGHAPVDLDADSGYQIPDESVINAQTFIKADTFIQSNDPKSELPTKPTGAGATGAAGGEGQDEEVSPKEQYGCLGGCVRDRHFKHGVLYAGNVLFLFIWFIRGIQWRVNNCEELSTYNHSECSSFFMETRGLAIFVWLVIFLLFLVEFFCSSTGKYLRNMNKTEDIMDYMERLYLTKPSLAIKIECYHYETRVVYYTDSNGNTCSRTETYPVVTYQETEPVIIVSWKDDSIHLQLEEVKEYQVTKVRLDKTFTADENFNDQCQELIARNRWRDLYYNFYTFYEIDGFKEKVLAFVDVDKIPPALHYGWCLTAHLTLFASLPYRIWMSSITGKVDTTVHKLIWTAKPV